jgi:WhiB family redox-sensing transcriptional regulator
MWNQDWAAAAACRGQQPDKLFVRGAEQNKAKQVCGACPVRTECLAEALDNQIEWGVWDEDTDPQQDSNKRRATASGRPLPRHERADLAQPGQVVHVARKGGHHHRRHLRVGRFEAPP